MGSNLSKKNNKNSDGKENLNKKEKEKNDVIFNKKSIDSKLPLFNYKFIRDIAIDSYSYGIDNTMDIFKSINNNILYFIYTNRNYSIISYNLINNQKINEIKKAHDSSITNFRHYLYKEKNQELIISTSINNNLKLWRINNWECLLNIELIYEKGCLWSACFLILENKINILTTNSYAYGPIKVYNLNGVKIKEINNSIDGINYIDIYYDNKNMKIYILTGNKGFVKSYDYNDNNIYHIYKDNDIKNHNSLRIINENNLIKLIESSLDGNIRIWNFHTGQLLNKIYISDKIYGICLWDNDYLFVGCDDNTIKILDVKQSKVIKKILGHKRSVLVLLKVNIPKYGECLISQENGRITKLWAIKLIN